MEGSGIGIWDWGKSGNGKVQGCKRIVGGFGRGRSGIGVAPKFQEDHEISEVGI